MDIRLDDPLFQELLAEIGGIPTVDAHEHLPTEAAHIAGKPDFYSLFRHYCKGDLVAAGATEADLSFWADGEKPVERRWQSFRPYFQAIRTGGYARSALLVLTDLMGIPDLTDDTYQEVGRSLAEWRKPGLYDRVLRDKCNLIACIQCWHLGEDGPPYFYHLAPGPELVDLTNRSALDKLAVRCNRSIHTLDDVLACMTQVTETWRKDPKVVGIKSAHAYARGLGFRKTERSEAERLFNAILDAEGHALSAREAIPLQDFLMFQLVARAEALGLPMVFHTGLQAGNYGRIANANPLLLQPILEEFPRARVDLYHAGIPWIREIAVLAKYFPGVHLNMAWTHVINPAMARSALSEWLDMVPNTKIFGFGGDYAIVEKVYGHLTLARRNVAAVLAAKVREGAFDRKEASRVARLLMRENAERFYGLKLP